MAVHGDLSTMPVGELLMWISNFRKTGTLIVRTLDHDEKIAFDQGFLIFSSSSDLKRTFGRLLVQRGLLSEENHDQARKIREEEQIALAKVLKELNFLPEDEILRLLRKKAEAEIFDLFKSDQGEFTFRDEPMPELDLLPLRVDVSKALLHVTQQLDEGEEFDFDESGINLDIPRF
jgi:hypothetical protein